MAEIFYDDGADLSVIQRRHVAVLGYGSQGHAHALSLRDSGVDVRVGLPEGSKSREKAANDGLRVTTPAEACEESDLVMVLVPDHLQRELILIKVRADAESRSRVLEAVNLFRAKVVDVALDVITVEATGHRDKLDALIKVLEPFGIKELVQSGMVAIGRCGRSITDRALRPVERSA